MEDDTRRVDTRSTLALLLVTGILSIGGYLVYTQPDTDVTKMYLGGLMASLTAVIAFYFGSTSSSERKDATQAKVAERLAEVAAAPANGTSAQKFTWVSLMSDEERAKLDEAAKMDGRVKTFIAASQVGRATPEDLDYLVEAGILTEGRPAQLQSANKPTTTT
jgi:hypothetical protein